LNYQRRKKPNDFSETRICAKLNTDCQKFIFNQKDKKKKKKTTTQHIASYYLESGQQCGGRKIKKEDFWLLKLVFNYFYTK
jgi:hypothetical protein